MKIQIHCLATILVFLLACSTAKIEPTECEPMICTQEFRVVQVKFTDVSGNPVMVKNYSAINKRTGQSTDQTYEQPIVNQHRFFTVASDADIRKLSESGDVITVSATHPETNNTVLVEFVISGGKCACHISKISGPSEIKI